MKAVAVLLAFSFYPWIASSQEDTVLLKNITVTARGPERSSTLVTTINARTIELIQPLQVQDVLRNVPGLFVRDYGGLGGVKSVSMRGGSAAQTLVMIDGQHFNAAQSGQLDLSTIPASFIESVVVEQGALSAIHGANAMTGAIDLRLKVADEDQIQATMETGSWSMWRLQAGGSTGSNTVRVGAGFEAYATDGSYPYDVEIDGDDASLNRTNADSRAVSAMIRMEAGEVLTITSMGRLGERGVPGAVVSQSSYVPQARLEDQDAMVQARYRAVTSVAHQVWCSVGGRYLDQRYQDPDSRLTGPNGIDSRFLMRDVVLEGHWQTVTGDVSHHVSIDGGYVDLRGDALQPEVDDFVKRQRAGMSYEVTYGNDQHFQLEGSARFDTYSDAGAAWNGMVGGLFHIVPDVVDVMASVGTGFRPPSFNELYFLNYGTSTLEPERSVSLSVGADITPLPWLRWKVAGFGSRITDLIIGIPINPVVTSAQNVGLATSYGIESLVAIDHLGPWSIEWSYTLQDVRDRTGRSGLDGTLVPYVPQEMIGINGSWNDALFMGRLEWSYASYRFAQPGGEATNVIAPYHLCNVMAGFHVPSSFARTDIMLRIDNVFDTRYEIVRGYPMPGMQFRLTLKVST